MAEEIKRIDMVYGYMQSIESLIGSTFEMVARMVALTAQDGAARPDIARFANQTQMNIELASMWYTKLAYLTEKLVKEEDNEDVSDIEQAD